MAYLEMVILVPDSAMMRLSVLPPLPEKERLKKLCNTLHIQGEKQFLLMGDLIDSKNFLCEVNKILQNPWKFLSYACSQVHD